MLRLPAPLAFAALALAMPAAAQDPAAVGTDVAEEKVNMVIVYGNDTCPQSTAEEITVCARKPESERFRIPENLRLSDDPANTAWAERVEKLEMVGAFGTMSCSPVGAGGFTGCTQKMIADAYADKREGQDIRFGELIAEARAERLSTIDEEAAAEQERVEQIEREYMERLERERDGAAAGEEALPPPPTEPDE